MPKLRSLRLFCNGENSGPAKVTALSSETKMGNRDSVRMLDAVNAWRASRGLTVIPASQIGENDFSSVDLKVSKSFAFAGTQRLELIAQVFNVFGRDNLQAAWVTNALSNAFGQIRQALNRQQGEVAIRFAW